MKAKKIEQKLVLKKETIANLAKEEQGAVYGGATLDDCTYRICTRVFVCDTDTQC